MLKNEELPEILVSTPSSTLTIGRVFSSFFWTGWLLNPRGVSELLRRCSGLSRDGSRQVQARPKKQLIFLGHHLDSPINSKREQSMAGVRGSRRCWHAEGNNRRLHRFCSRDELCPVTHVHFRPRSVQVRGTGTGTARRHHQLPRGPVPPLPALCRILRVDQITVQPCPPLPYPPPLQHPHRTRIARL